MNASGERTVDLREMRRYLLRHGWSRVQHPNERIELFRTTADPTGDYSTLSVPATMELSDAAFLVREAVRLLADHEKIPIENLIDRVHKWDRDILRARTFLITGSEDSLPFDIAAETISGLKDFMGYAAYTEFNPQPFFDKTGGVSSEFTNLCRFAHTFRGSFGITVECPLAIVPVLPIEGIEPVAPFARRVFERVAAGLVSLRGAIERQSLDGMLAGYQRGFSANMCRALAEVYERAAGRRIEYDILWSSELQSPVEQNWKPFVFEGRAYEFARAAAGELEKVEKFPDSVIEGRVVALRSDTPPGLDQQEEFEHVITMLWEREKDQAVRIRVPLSAQQYIQACDAHKEGRAIRIFGVPEVWRFSGALRRGISEVLALGAVREEESGVGAELRFVVRASAVVRRVLPPGCSWRRWASLGELLPLLMEAAPEVVQEAIERDIASATPQLLELLKQETPGGILGTIYHSGLLWAEETAAWPKERFQRVALSLARLAKLDPGGTWSNRPLASLASLFFSWRPQTLASVSERIEALRYLERMEPGQAWKVALELLPEIHESISDNPKPSYRNWAAGWTGQVTQKDYNVFISQLVGMAVRLAEEDVELWPELLDHAMNLPPQDFQKVVAGLERLTTKLPDESLRTRLWNKLRDTVQRHTYLRDARWALPEAELAKLAELRDRLAPKDLVTLHAPLFNDDGFVDGDQSEPYERKQERRERERRVAIRTVWRARGEGIILELAQEVRQPWSVGWSLAAELGAEAAEKIVPVHLASDVHAIRNCAAAFARQRIQANGQDWAERQISGSWTTEQVAAWALQMPFGARVWDWVASRGDLVGNLYWAGVAAWGHVNLDLVARSRAAAELQKVGRAWSALQLLMQAKYDKCPLTPEVVCEALEAVTENPTERSPGAMDEHDIHEAFAFLQSCRGADETRVAKLEFEFLALLDGYSVLPMTLQRQLAKDPDFFVECLKLLYRPHREAKECPDKEQSAPAGNAEKAKRIWRLLRDWRAIPGTDDRGAVSADALRSWICVAREKAREADRLEVCDITLGEMFARSPEDADKALPVVAIREVIEECESRELERGFSTGLHNLRGCFSKQLYEGGKQERDLAAHYGRYATACARWPRTAAVLRGVSKDYLAQAEHEDERARTRD